MRLRFRRKFWPMVPGLAVAGFAIAAVILPVGSDGLGAHVSRAPGVLPATARWARDIHDGFWRPKPHVTLVSTRRNSFGSPLSNQRRRAQELCWLGRAREAVALYREIGVLTDSDRQALLGLGARLVYDADHDLSEWFAREGDRLLGGAILRNNLAWHYTQLGIRQHTALELAMQAVMENRTACNVDTLAWAQFGVGNRRAARETAEATLAIDDPWLTPLLREQQELAKQSSRRLLDILRSGQSAEHYRRERAPEPLVPAQSFGSRP